MVDKSGKYRYKFTNNHLFMIFRCHVEFMQTTQALELNIVSVYIKQYGYAFQEKPILNLVYCCIRNSKHITSIYILRAEVFSFIIINNKYYFYITVRYELRI